MTPAWSIHSWEAATMKKTTKFIITIMVCVIASAVVVSALQQPTLARDSTGTFHYGTATFTVSATRPDVLQPGCYRHVNILDGMMTYLDVCGGRVPDAISDKIVIPPTTGEARVIL